MSPYHAPNQAPKNRAGEKTPVLMRRISRYGVDVPKRPPYAVGSVLTSLRVERIFVARHRNSRIGSSQRPDRDFCLLVPPGGGPLLQAPAVRQVRWIGQTGPLAVL